MGLLSGIEIALSSIIKNIRSVYSNGSETELRKTDDAHFLVKRLKFQKKQLKKGELLKLIEKINLLNGLLNRTSSMTINELINSCTIDGLNASYHAMKNRIRKKCLPDLAETSFDSNLVNIQVFSKPPYMILKKIYFQTYSMISFCREQYTYYLNYVSKIFAK
jgi:hypothetical protein